MPTRFSFFLSLYFFLILIVNLITSFVILTIAISPVCRVDCAYPWRLCLAPFRYHRRVSTVSIMIANFMHFPIVVRRERRQFHNERIKL